MKRLLYLLVPAMFLFACGGGTTTTESKDETTTDSTTTQVQSDERVCENMVNINDLLNNIATYCDKEIAVCGLCKHVCHNGGGKMKIAASENDTIMLTCVKTPDMDAIPAEMVDKNIMVKGIVKSSTPDNAIVTHSGDTIKYYVEIISYNCCKKHCNDSCTHHVNCPHHNNEQPTAEK